MTAEGEGSVGWEMGRWGRVVFFGWGMRWFFDRWRGWDGQSGWAMERRIVFFDGVCGLCNAAVDALIRLDEDGVLRFATLQGETARELLPADRWESLDTMVFWEEGRIYVKSDAALRIALRVGGGLQVFYPLVAVPRRWRDAVYSFVAKRRYAWFGKKESCRMPTPEERALFLD